MPVYVEIAVNVPQVSGVFHYHLPPELEGQVSVGQLVEVPFGPQRMQGVVLQFIDEPEVEETKAVTAIIDDAAVVTPPQTELAKKISEVTLAPLAASMGLMLPVGLTKYGDSLYSLTKTKGENEFTEIQRQVVKMLKKRGPLRGRQIERALPRRNWQYAVQQLLKRGELHRQAVLSPPTVRPKYVRTVQLSASPEIISLHQDPFSKQKSVHKRRQALIGFIKENATSPLSLPWVYAELRAETQKEKEI